MSHQLAIQQFKFISLSVVSYSLLMFSSIVEAQSGAFIDDGNVSGNFNLRYESSDQDNALEDAQALTLRSRLNFSSGVVSGFSALVEIEDVRIVGGLDDYSVGPTGFNVGRYSVIADPESTELDQGFLQYSDESFTAKIGRQVITYDNHRFIGHVGWRQDRQTFDAVSFALKPNENLNLSYNFIDKRRRIFADDADLDSKDHLFHGDYKTSFGTVSAYAYLLELDNSVRNSLDTYGVRLVGARSYDGFDVSYTAEYATQDSETALSNNDAEYLLLEAGITVDGISARIGREQLGSDDGAYGFSAPLATLHAHNGWADLFLGPPAGGLIDTYVNIGGKAGKGNWAVIYHDFEVDDGPSDLGGEFDLQYVYPISESTSLGLKYASYSGADLVSGKPDTDKFWIWLNFGF